MSHTNSLPKPSNDELWVMAVENWLHHIANAYVERCLLHALEKCGNDIECAIEHLVTFRDSYSLGNCGSGSPDGLKVDVGGSLRAPDLIIVRWGDWFGEPILTISLKEVLEYLKKGKRRDTQMELF